MRLDGKIQLSFALLIAPLTIAFVLLFLSLYRYNRQYDIIMTNAAEAGKFSIDFKEKFDQKMYFLFVGRSEFAEADPYQDIEEAKAIVAQLIENTNVSDNAQRAQAIQNMLDNLHKYVKRMEDNRKESGHYDANKAIWENDVQTVTSLITRYVLEYAYYENLRMEELRDEIKKGLGVMIWSGAAVLTALIPLALFVSGRIARSIVKPIHYLSGVTDEVARGNLSVRAETLRGAEVRALGASLNIMIQHIAQLMDEVKRDQATLRQAELELLQAQINPHFLYNTLDTIIWLAEDGQKQQIVEMVKSLSDFFRTSLNYGADLATLREEERHVRSYLQIQQVRYQDILEYYIDIPADFYEARLPKITLQPLVENALYHGIKRKRGKGVISIQARRSGDAVIVTVKDDGAGMTADKLDSLRELLAQREVFQKRKDSYGLYNVNERIKLKFGSAYGITIMAAPGEGVAVEIRLPKIIN